MSRWQRFKRWIRRKNDLGVPDEIDADVLREFVYLDDISVDSLVASVRGGVLDQIKQTTGTELQSELGGTFGASTPVATAEVRSRLQSTSSKGLETLRRAGIQARFRELHQIVDQRRLLRPLDRTDGPPRVASLGELRGQLARHDSSPWIIRVSDLRRGGVVEVDVELGSEPLFHLVSAMSQMLDLWPQNPALVGLDALDNADQLQGLSTMLSDMLGGLVPIRSRAVDLEVIDLDGERWLLPSEMLEGLPVDERIDRRPLEVVGVTAPDLFWKDQRRILFAGARYRVMARLVLDGASTSWTPVKMVDTFKDLIPGFGEAIDQLAKLGREHIDPPATAALPEPQTVPPAGGPKGNPARSLVETYGKVLGELAGVQITEGDLEAAGLTEGVMGDLPTLEQSRGLLDPVTTYVQGLLESDLDPVMVSNTRLEVHRTITGAAVEPTTTASKGVADGKEAEPVLLEVEFVAIYW